MSSLRWVGSAVFVGLVVGMAGCKPGTALHSRYNNFRAYYNAYYNAERKLEEGEEALQGRNQRLDRGRLVELFPTGSATGQGGAFQETVDKSAELLRERPESKWADDALLLIGKAYFYQRNFVGAEQKFRETADAAVVRNEPRLADEARFWLGRTYAATERYEEGVAILQDALAQTEIDPRWRAQIQLALGELYGRAERWAESATAIREGLGTVRDRELAARAYLLLGQVEEASGNWDAAAEAYASAADRAPAYELEYAARLNEALVLGLDAGRADEALERVRAMRRDDKNFQQRAEVELAWARIQAASGDEVGARRRFRNVLYDEELAGGTVRGEAHFRLAEFYRDIEKDFVRASAHFDTAATALPAVPDASVQLSRAAIRDPRRDAETFTSIAVTSRRIAEMDSLLALASLSEEEFEVRIQEIEAERRRVFLEEQRQTNQLRANAAFQGNVEGAQLQGVDRSGDAALQRTVAGFLGYRDPATLQAGRVAFEQTWGDRALVPNWRRRAAIEASAIETAVGSGAVENQARLPTGPGPPPLDLSVIPRTPEQRRQLAVSMAEMRYELANALFLSLSRADSAVVLYRSILTETPEAPVAPRARYALAEIEYAAGRLDAATPLFQGVIDADPESDLARAARNRLGIGPIETEDTRPEISDRSAERFTAARQRWSGGDPLGAMMDFIALGEADPDAPVAPRAFLAGAAAYADFARGDSLLLTGALPDSLAPALFRDTLELVTDTSSQAVDERPDDLQIEADAAPLLNVEVDELPVEPGDELDPEEEEVQRRRRQPDRPQPVDVNTLSDVEDVDEMLRRPQAPRPVETPAPVADDAVELSPATPEEPEAIPAFLADSLATDSLAVPEDAPASDSLRAALPVADPALTDSLLVVADSLVVPDSPQVPDAPSFTFADYLDALAERYPQTPEAEQARTLSAALPRAEPPAAPPATDPVVVAQPEVEEPETVAPQPDPVAAPVDLDANPYGTFGSAPLNPTVGGFSRRTNALADAIEASELVRQLVEEGFRAAVGTDGVDIFVVVGQFPSDKALAIATSELPAATLGAGTGIVRLEDIELLPLGDGEDGR